MMIVATILVALVAAIHLYILVLEMFLWRTPRARAAFGTTPEFADASATMAANQGLYNGFLAAGLIWGLLAPQAIGRPVTYFFLGCVAVAGLYGAATVSRRILLVQTVPAALAAAALTLSG
jgi:putative membrane protein